MVSSCAFFSHFSLQMCYLLHYLEPLTLKPRQHLEITVQNLSGSAAVTGNWGSRCPLKKLAAMPSSHGKHSVFATHLSQSRTHCAWAEASTLLLWCPEASEFTLGDGWCVCYELNPLLLLLPDQEAHIWLQCDVEAFEFTHSASPSPIAAWEIQRHTVCAPLYKILLGGWHKS